MERMPKSDAEGGLMKAFCAIICSTGRVTNCSTSCAVAPGQAMEATATRTGMLGSLRLGMCIKPYQPHRHTAINRTSETWRCSVKKRAVLCVCAMYSDSALCVMQHCMFAYLLRKNRLYEGLLLIRLYEHV